VRYCITTAPYLNGIQQLANGVVEPQSRVGMWVAHCPPELGLLGLYQGCQQVHTLHLLLPLAAMDAADQLLYILHGASSEPASALKDGTHTAIGRMLT
jgi:hypothetical protein